MTEAGAQNVADHRADLVAIRLGFVHVPCRQTYVSRGEDAVGHVFYPHVEVDGARGHGAVRHSGIFRAGTVTALGECQPTSRLDRLEPQGTVMAGAGQNDADRVLGQT